MKLAPLHDYIVFRMLKQSLTRGGLHIPEKSQDNQDQAIVVAVGPGALLDNGQVTPMPVKVGDRVLIANGQIAATSATGPELFLCRVSQVLAIFEREASDDEFDRKIITLAQSGIQ